ncbi:uncharacterized protein LOC118749119 [Rhagoletis pomonella]|uniref:uncharacterized protein LOC118749119 n=1 Tax=Rhagoletis pomonella TaxID=28610 RepID=UPI00177B632F|nr:uncharacterized protein LOC118749119 [Rhagoletis pomonella]
MFDQHNERKRTIPEYLPFTSDEVLTELPTIATDNDDQTYQPNTSEMLMDIDELPSATQQLSAMKRGPYTARYNIPNFVMMCDRFGVSDRVAACIATALLEDLNIRDEKGDFIIMDKRKVARERLKYRDVVLSKQRIESNLKAFSFDGRKNDSLTQQTINQKYHQNMVKEPHLVVAREPNTVLIGYVELTKEDAESKQKQLFEFFNNKQISLEHLIGICSDGEPANTGTYNGVLRRFELHLKKPLHWFVCLLHFNELPFRHLYQTLDQAITFGPRSTTGKLDKQIQECETLQVATDFEHILLENMPPAMDEELQCELSTDVKYLYKMANAISNGVCPADLANMKPGPSSHSRWITRASRILRFAKNNVCLNAENQRQFNTQALA